MAHRPRFQGREERPQ